MFKANNKDTRTTSRHQLRTCFTSFPTVPIVDFDHLFVCWVSKCLYKDLLEMRLDRIATSVGFHIGKKILKEI